MNRNSFRCAKPPVRRQIHLRRLQRGGCDSNERGFAPTLGRMEEKGLWNCPGGCSNNVQSPFMSCDRTVSFSITSPRLPKTMGGRRNQAIQLNGFAIVSNVPPDGGLLPHHQCPMADGVLRTGVFCAAKQEVHIEATGTVLRAIALV